MAELAHTWEGARAFPTPARRARVPWFGLSATQGRVLIELLIIIAAPLMLLAMSRPFEAGRVFWLAFFAVLAVLAVLVRGYEMLVLLLGLGPIINLLRQFATYNIIVVLYVCVLGYCIVMEPGCLRRLLAWPLVWILTACVALFWLASLYHTRDYAVNLRMFELAFSVTGVLIISHYPKALGGMLLGLLITSLGMGAAMIPYHLESGGRLGLMVVGDYILGNPVQLGVPLALSFLALNVDRGRWLSVARPWIWRVVFTAPVLLLLFLTTSRAAWGILALGLFVGLCFAKRHRAQVLMLAVFVVMAVMLIIRAPWAESFTHGLNRTFEKDRSLASRTSGRSDQWKVSWYAFTRSAQSILVGYGPGSGAEVYLAMAPEVEEVQYGVGKRVALHSLYMQMMVELGLTGVLAISCGLGWLLWKGLMEARVSGLVFPLSCLVAYGFVVVTVSGNDTVSGILLGMACAGTTLAGGRGNGHVMSRSCPRNATSFHAEELV